MKELIYILEISSITGKYFGEHRPLVSSFYQNTISCYRSLHLPNTGDIITAIIRPFSSNEGRFQQLSDSIPSFDAKHLLANFGEWGSKRIRGFAAELWTACCLPEEFGYDLGWGGRFYRKYPSVPQQSPGNPLLKLIIYLNSNRPQYGCPYPTPIYCP